MRLLRLARIPLRRLVMDQRAATAVEYGLIAALIVIAMISALKGMANATTGMWNNTSETVQRVSR